MVKVVSSLPHPGSNPQEKGKRKWKAQIAFLKEWDLEDAHILFPLLELHLMTILSFNVAGQCCPLFGGHMHR